MYATLGALTFRGDDQPATYTIAKMPGWWGGVDFRHEQEPRPTSDGDFDAPVTQSGRIITLEGQVHASGAEEFEDAIAALEDLLGDGSMGTLTVYQANGTYTLQVRRHGGLNLDVLLYGHNARYQVQLWAPNPAKVLVP
jgi:hypothetical protein